MERVVRLQVWVGTAVRGLMVQQFLVGREVREGTVRARKRLPHPRPPALNATVPPIRLQLTRMVGCSAMSVTGGGMGPAWTSPVKCLACSARLLRKGCRFLGGVHHVSQPAPN